MRIFFFPRGRRALLRLAALWGCWAAAAALLTGCGSSRLNSFTWEVEAVPSNLDPQTVSDSAGIIAVTHLYSGLYRLDESGTPQPDCAESCQVSADGLIYTFTLKEGLGYNGYRNASVNTALTAQDFVFGLRRVFLPETGSPWARPLGNIQNGAAVAEGRLGAEQLGASAPDDLTLVIRLEQPDENFLEKLCLPGAMPCNQEYFESTKGAYGLQSKTTLGNGPFYLYNWTDSGLFLRRRASGASINSLRLVLAAQAPAEASPGPDSEEATPAAASQTAQEKIEGERVSAALSDTDSGGALTELPYTTTTWALVYNCEKEGLSSTAVRQGLSASATQTELTLPAPYSPAQGLLPPGVEIDGESYRQSAGPVLFTSDDPVSLYKSGLAQAGLEGLSGITVLVPQGQPAQLFGSINQQWQMQLSAFFTVRELPLAELWQAVESGDYQIALLPLSPPENDPLSLLAQLAEGEPGGWRDAGFAAACAAEAASYQPAGRSERIAALEQQVMVACPLTPVFYETQYLLVDPAVKGLIFQPFGPILDVSAAQK